MKQLAFVFTMFVVSGSLISQELDLKSINSKSILAELNIEDTPGLRLPESSLNDVPFLVGELISLDTATDGTIKISSVRGLNYLVSNDKLSFDQLFEGDGYSYYIDNQTKTKLSLIRKIFGEKEVFKGHVLKVKYGTVFNSSGKRNFINQERLQDDIEEKFAFLYKELFVIRSVLVKELSYQAFISTSDKNTVDTPIIKFNKGYYHATSDERKRYDIILNVVSYKIKSHVFKKQGGGDNVSDKVIVTLTRSEPQAKTLTEAIYVRDGQ